MPFLQHVVVDTRTVVEAIRVGYRREFAQVAVAGLVLGQQYKVPSAAVHDSLASGLGVYLLECLVLVVECSARAVRLDAYNRLEWDVLCRLLLQFGKLRLQLRFLSRVGLLLYVLLALLNSLLALAVYLPGSIHQILDAEHVAVVGERHGVHAVFLAFAYQIRHFRHAVEYRIMRVYMKMNEVSHNCL